MYCTSKFHVYAFPGSERLRLELSEDVPRRAVPRFLVVLVEGEPKGDGASLPGQNRTDAVVMAGIESDNATTPWSQRRLKETQQLIG